MFTRILVAVDGSETSRRAFDAALELARSHGAVLQAFYAVENTPMYFEAPGYDPSILRNRMIEQARNWASSLGRSYAIRASKAMW